MTDALKDCPLCGSMQVSRWTVGSTVQCNACGCNAPFYTWQNRPDKQQQIDNRDYLIAEYQTQIEMLKDPVVVHMGMLRGGIAKLSWENIKHLYPEQFKEEDHG